VNDDVTHRSEDAPPVEARERTETRRDFIKKAAAVGLALPAAGALAGSAAARSTIQVRDRARSQYEGVTLSFAKAPFGNDEKDVIAKLLKPFTDKTGIKYTHTVVPWQTEGAAYATNYAGPNPYDVSYQTSTDLTSLGQKGVLEVLNTSQWLNAPSFASTKAKFIPGILQSHTWDGKIWGLPCIIGGTVIYYNKDLLKAAGVNQPPATYNQLVAAAKKVTDAPNVWGFSVPLTNQDFTWYFLYNNLHNWRGEMVSRDGKRATFNTRAFQRSLQQSVDLVLKHKVQPPVGQYNRDAALALFTGGRLAMVQDEPLRLPVFRDQKLPFAWDFINPVGSAGKRTIFSTSGTWVMAAKGKNKGAAWELVKYLSSPAFASEFGNHYGWAPVRKDVNTAGGDKQVARVNKYVLTSWDGLKVHPKNAQLTNIYGQAIEAAATGKKTVAQALADAQKEATRVLRS
jgi:multiple sugar transport system substrate-binding protein